MKGLVYTVASGLTTIANTALSLGSIVRRYGCGVNANGANVVITRPGYYDADVSATVTNDTAGALTVTLVLNENSAAVPGATGTVTLPAGASATVSFSSTVRAFCGVNKTLQVVPSIAGITVDNLAVRVTEV